MLKEKLKEFFSSEELSTELLECQTEEEAKKLLSAHGVDVTDEEMKILKDYIDKFVEKDGKLSEEDLDEISGGWSVSEIASTPTRVFTESIVAIALSPVEGLKTAVARYRGRVKEIENSYDHKQTPTLQPFWGRV